MSLLKKITGKWYTGREELVNQYFENNESEIALAILDNHINRMPGNIELVNFYARVVEGLIEDDRKTGNYEDANLKIRWLNQFYTESSKHVNIKYVPELIQLANKKEYKTSTVISTEKKILPKFNNDKHVGSLVKQVNNRSKRTTALSSELRNVLNSLADSDKNFQMVSDALEKVDITIRFEEFIKSIDSVLTEKNNLPDERLQVHFLQRVEMMLKELTFLLPKLEAEYYSDFQLKKEQLEKETYKYRETINKEKWSKFISNFEKDNEHLLKKVKQNMTVSSKATSCVETANNLIATISENYMYQFGGQSNKKYTSYLEDLHKICSDWVEFRYDRYQQWALDKIKTAFNQGMKHVGITNDREDIADIVVTKLGEIDQALLKPLTTRLYSECLEYFLGKLKTPKKDIFNNKESKPRVIELIARKKKKSLESF
ncbi:MAG: hypothetical protein HOK35_17005 [Cytophagia bacterium]|nr:hypothetical protein [Cytophagia bacterium]